MSTPPHMSNELEIAWAAGFWDGEGSAYIERVKRADGTKSPVLRLWLGQIDPRPLERFARAVGTDRPVLGPYNHTHMCNLRFSAKAEVERVIELLWPYLGEAKREQIAQCRQAIEENTMLYQRGWRKRKAERAGKEYRLALTEAEAA